MIQSDDFRYFAWSEFDCQHTGNNEMDPEFIHDLDCLREACGFPFVITSGYRDVTHPVESAKSKPGQHTLGIAADIAVNDGVQRRLLVHKALLLGFTGIGVAKTFVHVDRRKTTPVMWVYS